MSDLRFAWDLGKARINEEKHGVSFDEATTVFLDEEALLIGDPDHSVDEDRFLLLGLSSRVRLLTVCHCVREPDPHPSDLRAQSDETGAGAIPLEVPTMRTEYDFSKGKKNPYPKRLKRQITIRLDEPTIDYFRGLAEETGVRYQTLINLYLRDCAEKKRRLSMAWRTG